MNQPLVGWDLATWRVSQSEAGFNPNIICIAEISGEVPLDEIRRRANQLSNLDGRLQSVIVNNELVRLENLDLSDAVFHVESSVRDLVQKFLKQTFSDGERLWSIGVIYSKNQTFLVSLVHHAIADGNKALNYLLSLFDNFEFKIESEKQIPIHNEDSKSSQFEIGKFVRRFASDPVGLITDINALITSSGKMLPDLFSQSQSKLKLEANYEIVGLKVSTSKLNELAELHSVKSHDVLMAMAISIFDNLGVQIQPKDRELVVNVPVAFNAGPMVANQILVARLRFPQDSSIFEEIMKKSRQKLQDWRREPALKLAPRILNLVNVVSDGNLCTVVANSDMTVSSLKTESSKGSIACHEVLAIWPVVNPLGAAMNFTALVGKQDTNIGICIDATKTKFDWKQFLSAEEIRKLDPEPYFFEQIFE